MHANLRTTYGDGAGVHFVVIFREPVDRAFSEHCMFTHGTPPPGSAPAERSGAICAAGLSHRGHIRASSVAPQRQNLL